MVFYPTSFTCLHRRFMKNLQCAAQICPSAGRTRTAIHKRRHGSRGDPGAVGDGVGFLNVSAPKLWYKSF